MSTPQFVVIPVNEPIPEAVTKGSDRSLNRPAFYTLTTPEGQVYAGSTSGIGGRLNDHKGMLKAGKHAYPSLQNAVTKNQPIHVAVKYTSSREEAYDVEQAFLTSNANNPNLLNKSLDARNPGKGHTVSEDGKQRLREFNTGKILSEEHRRKMSEARQGHRPSEYAIQRSREVRLGKPLSEETRQKISESHKTPAAREAIEKALGRPVEINGIVHPSLTAAGKVLGVGHQTVANRVNSPNPKFSNYNFKD